MNHRINGILTLHRIMLAVILTGWFCLFLFVWEENLKKSLDESAQPYMYLMCSVLAIFFSSFASLQEYDVFFSMKHWQSFRKSILMANFHIVVIAFFVFATVFATKDKSTSRFFLGSLIFSYWPLLVVFNFIIPIFLREFFLRSDALNSALLVGSEGSFDRLKNWVTLYARKGFIFKGALMTGENLPDESRLNIPVLGHIDKLDATLREGVAKKVIVVPDRAMESWLPKVIESCYRNGCRVLIYNPFSSFFDAPLIPVEESGLSFFTFQNEPLESPFNRSIKRICDFLVSFSMVVFVLPLLTFVVWFFQRLQSPGPIFFTQERIGMGGQTFTIIKYRSMEWIDNRDGESVQATSDDPRVFSFGRLLRKYSLDEMPQFINVLRGDMSVVGPRPFMPCHDDLFSQNFKAYRVRQYVKPGLTGPAQCRGLRGEVVDPEALNQRIEMDFHYVGNWSIWLDLEIVLRTVVQVLFPPKTAY